MSWIVLVILMWKLLFILSILKSRWLLNLIINLSYIVTWVHSNWTCTHFISTCSINYFPPIWGFHYFIVPSTPTIGFERLTPCSPVPCQHVPKPYIFSNTFMLCYFSKRFTLHFLHEKNNQLFPFLLSVG